jgi:hypothetical protein
MPGPSHQREQAERRAIIKAEQLRPGDQQPTTLHALANLDTSLGGRFAKADYVAGQGPSVDYPAAGDWTRNAGGVGIEPPLGFSVNDIAPTGEAFEVERSLASLGGSVAAPAMIPSSEAASPPAIETADPPIPTAPLRRRKIT